MDTPKPKFNSTSTGGRKPYAGKSGDRKPRATFERAKPEFDQKVIDIRRVTRVVSGGRRMSFAVALAIGDKKGSIGLGTGKGGDTALAMAKALRVARKNMFRIATTKDNSIAHEVSAKYGSSRVVIMPNRGKGLVAGSTVREMLTLGGIKNVTAKIHSGSKNKLNNSRATYQALYQLRSKDARKAEVVKEVNPSVETDK